MSITTIKHALVSAAVLASAGAMVATTPHTHAAPAARAIKCLYNCIPNPTLTLYGENGSVIITGAHWTPNLWINVTVYLPVSVGGNVTNTAAYSDKNGNIDIAWEAPYGCLYQQVEVQAADPITGKYVTSYAVPGCIG